jgi:hypothetical protein
MAGVTGAGAEDDLVLLLPSAGPFGDVRPTRLRLHDILLWLTTTLRLAHAVELGRRSDNAAEQEWDGTRTSAALPM